MKYMLYLPLLLKLVEIVPAIVAASESAYTDFEHAVDATAQLKVAVEAAKTILNVVEAKFIS